MLGILSNKRRYKGGIVMKLGATLYVKNSTEAVEYYKDAFGMTLGYSEKNPDGTFLHAALFRDGDEIFAVSESQNDNLVAIMLKSSMKYSRPTMSLGINFNTKEEVQKAYEILSAGGNVLLPLGSLPWSEYAADVVDKFGVCWYIAV
jgi:uncharacterized glyoxalase superfamily protein PhnB